MNTWLPIAFGVLGTGGGGFGLYQWLRFRTDVRSVNANTDLSVVEAAKLIVEGGDARSVNMAKAQMELIVLPLEKRVDRLDKEVRDLHEEVRTVRGRYRLAMDGLRAFTKYAATLAGLLNQAGVTFPPPPPLPAEIDNDY